jgi:manganese efflux pump family protein
MLALLVVAVSVGMSNLAAAVAIGVSGVDARTRIRVGLVFGAFESGMPIVGLIIGQQVAEPLGKAARWISAGLLIAVGVYALVTAIRGPRAGGEPGAQAPGGLGTARLPTARLLLGGLALSLDNLVVGFALGTYGTSIITSAVVIGVVSVVLSLIGLELGSRIGRLAGGRGEQLAGVMLISIGIAIAAGALR